MFLRKGLSLGRDPLRRRWEAEMTDVSYEDIRREEETE